MKEHGIPTRSRAKRAELDWAQADEERRNRARERLNQWREENIDRFVEYAAIAAAASQEVNGPTSIEKAMMDAFDNAGLDYVFQFEVGGKFLCDFAFPDAALIVECDGVYWHSTKEARKRDQSKDAYLEACGYTVLRFTDEEISSDIAACVDVASRHL